MWKCSECKENCNIVWTQIEGHMWKSTEVKKTSISWNSIEGHMWKCTNWKENSNIVCSSYRREHMEEYWVKTKVILLAHAIAGHMWDRSDCSEKL